MMGGVADIDSKGPRDDSTVAHNTTCELSTVLQQSNTSLICGCDHNTKVCKCTTCEDSKYLEYSIVIFMNNQRTTSPL